MRKEQQSQLFAILRQGRLGAHGFAEMRTWR
jgi:hypothetical protein